MIFDKLTNMHKYKHISKEIETAYKWIKENDIKTFENGKHQITDKIWLVKKEVKPVDIKDLVCEMHYETIDIHLSSGVEELVVFAPQIELSAKDILREYDKQSDTVLFKMKNKETVMNLSEDSFMLFMPFETHCPSINPNMEVLTKYIIKIKVD
ncbi:DUF386 domain-containing protein [Mycoplasma anserisalpingitidis]|uniref:DUF386 domain-containing protein n=1 Tax=Mycoplasma anserisalpingitidis TaxID=519450 RepID=A0A5B8J6U8_9MOLU|nr:YhcH/YjgK/YiaL family protein [Mycoplasma anserisalpingitidis]QDY86812.1 DUF386 domain-containing protein [Mycoplasma anserisalpingitidis]